jgi:hypothetical protein
MREMTKQLKMKSARDTRWSRRVNAGHRMELKRGVRTGKLGLSQGNARFGVWISPYTPMVPKFGSLSSPIGNIFFKPI